MSVFLYLSCVNLVAIPQLEGQHILRGQVVKEDSPVTDGYVMLHSVSSMRSGQVDSVSLSSEGYFEFQLQGFGDIGGSDEVYFASVDTRECSILEVLLLMSVNLKLVIQSLYSVQRLSPKRV